MTWQPKQTANWIKIKPGETFPIPISGPHSPKDFTDEEKGRAITAIDFELPFAVEGLQGNLPSLVKFARGGNTSIFLMSRQKNCDDIATSLRLVDLKPPKEGIIVGDGDRYGRINVSAIQFKIPKFIDTMERGQLFEDCLDWFNRFIEIYRHAKQDFRLRRIAKEDIFAYRMAHLLDGELFNDITQPVATLTLQALPSFPDDSMLRYKLWFLSQIRNELWVKLISEARHHLSVEDYRIVIINSITALETVLKEGSGRKLKEFFERHRVPFSRWKDKDTRESITVCLNLLNLLYDQLGLNRELTERVIQHYRRRNEIVHHGTMRVSAEDAQRCVNDIDFLIRYLLDLIHFSVTVRLVLATLPSSEVEFEVIKMFSPEMALQVNCSGNSLTVALQNTIGNLTHLKANLNAVGWAVGERVSLSVTYDANAGIAKLLFNKTEVDSVNDCQLGYIDASLLELEVTDARHVNFLPIQFVLLHNRVIQPHELEDIDSIFHHVSNEAKE
jgi:hypothetical protein